MKKREGDNLEMYSAVVSVFVDTFCFSREFEFCFYSPDVLYEFLKKHSCDIDRIYVNRLGEYYCHYQSDEIESFRADWCND